MNTAPQPCCLIAEDQALIGITLEIALEEAGIPVAGPFACAAEALAFAQQVPPCIAILDYKLKDGPCTELATALLAQGVPVIIYSGWPHDRGTPPELAGATWLEKPAAPTLSGRLLGAAA